MPIVPAAALALALLVPSFGAAADLDTDALLKAIIGNTLRIQDEDGARDMWVRAAPDGTYTNTVLRKDDKGIWHREIRFGVWYVKNGSYCREQQSPPPRPCRGVYCDVLGDIPALGHSTVIRGSHRRMSLLPGLQQPASR